MVVLGHSMCTLGQSFNSKLIWCHSHFSFEYLRKGFRRFKANRIANAAYRVCC